jgi:hypothetical protein
MSDDNTETILQRLEPILLRLEHIESKQKDIKNAIEVFAKPIKNLPIAFPLHLSE